MVPPSPVMNAGGGNNSPGPESFTWSGELYQELRRMAAGHMARQPPGHTLQATALVNEAWLRLGGPNQKWANRAHFFGAAAQAMRQILIDQARRKAAIRHGGGRERVELTESKIVGGAPDDDLLALDEALNRFAAAEPLKAELVKLRYFVGLTLEQAAEVLGISLPTAKRHWAFARAWLFREVRREQAGGIHLQQATRARDAKAGLSGTLDSS
jgi:RNA polymerase sigma factor (TIGR02999 family)